MTANVPVTFVFFRLVVPATVRSMLSVVAPCTSRVLCRFVAPVAVSVFNAVAYIHLTLATVPYVLTSVVPVIV